MGVLQATHAMGVLQATHAMGEQVNRLALDLESLGDKSQQSRAVFFDRCPL